MAVRLHFIVEGQTERRFVENTLRPHFSDRSIWIVARCVETSRSRGQKFSGGITNYHQTKKDIENWMKEDQDSNLHFTTMIDFYALPKDFPGYADAKKKRDPYSRIRVLEDALGEDISDRRFIPYIQLHEFEALLFSDPEKFESQFNDPAGIKKLIQIAEQFEYNPERIDDGKETAPSKRIIKEIAKYATNKALSGPIIAEKIGLTTLREKCSHFSEWIGNLESLGQENKLASTKTP